MAGEAGALPSPVERERWKNVLTQLQTQLLIIVSFNYPNTVHLKKKIFSLLATNIDLLSAYQYYQRDTVGLLDQEDFFMKEDNFLFLSINF